MSSPNISALVIGNMLHFPCSMSEFLDKIDSQLSESSSHRANVFLPFICVVYLFCSLLNSRSRLPQLELRKWHSIQHYWRHFHDWTEDEKALQVSEMYTYCRPFNYRYLAYSEEIRTKLTTFKDIPKKKTTEFSNVPKEYLHEGWNKLWYERKSKIRLLKGLVWTTTVLLVLQMAVFISFLVIQPSKSAEIHKTFLEEYHKFYRKEPIDGCMCAKQVRSNMTGLMRRVFFAIMKENIDCFSTFAYLLFFVIFSVYLARLSQSIIPPSLPRPLPSTETDKLEYVLPDSQLHFVRDYFLYLGLFSGLLLLLNIHLILSPFKVF